jgi:hypothetical protein
MTDDAHTQTVVRTSARLLATVVGNVKECSDHFDAEDRATVREVFGL